MIMEISLKTSTMVRPAKELPTQRLWNSDLDLVLPVFHMPSVYSYKPDSAGSSSSSFFDTGVLKEALTKVLVHFYPMAGRLGRDETGRLEIVCNSEGVLFIEAETSSAMADLGDFATSSELEKLVPNIEYYYSKDIFSYPLVAFQITRFECGAVTLGANVHHTLVDGISAFHFINSWSDMARGVPLSITPLINRSLLRPRDPPAVKFQHTEYTPPPTMNNAVKKTPCSQAVIQITSAQINALKRQVTSENDVTSRYYNTFSVLAAHLWRCVTKARGLPDDQETRLYIPTSGRSRLRPPLPSGYLGNVVFSTAITASSRDLQAQTFKGIVEMIQESVKRRDDEYLQSALDYLNTVPDITTIIPPMNTFQCPNLRIVSWVKMPIHDANFGWGKPNFMRPISVPYDGFLYILPSSKGDNNVTLIANLESSHMDRFQELLFLFE